MPMSRASGLLHARAIKRGALYSSQYIHCPNSCDYHKEEDGRRGFDRGHGCLSNRLGKPESKPECVDDEGGV